MSPLILVADHPALHRGFSTVARHLAHGFGANGWRVHCLGRYPPGGAAADADLDILTVDPDGAAVDGHVTRLAAALTKALGGYPGPDPVIIVCIGTAADVIDLCDAIGAAGLRDRVRVVGYFPVDFAPLPPEVGALVERVDIAVPFTQFARAALRSAGAADQRLAAPIPHGVDPDLFKPLSPQTRRQIRQDVFGLSDDVVLVGFFGRNSGHKRPDFALRIFQHFAEGTYWRCKDCARITPFAPDPIDGGFNPVARCGVCGSENGGQGAPRDDVRLYMHSERLGKAEMYAAQGWDLVAIADQLGLSDKVIWSPDLRIGHGLTGADLAARMAACDIHLLPYDSGGWELTVLETGACGIPNIITDTAAPPDYARPFSRCIPIAAERFSTLGFRGLIDFGAALEALEALANAPEERVKLGARGVDVARAHSWRNVVARWETLFKTL